jgi:Domain of unknown function (DUF4279)
MMSINDDNIYQLQCNALMQFSGENLDPERISTLLDIQPFSSKRKGEPMARPRPGRPTPLARRGGVSYSTYQNIVSDNINDHLRYLLQAVFPVARELRSLVDRDHLAWRIICFFDNPPADLRAALEPSIANRLDELGIELFLDDPNTVTFVKET